MLVGHGWLVYLMCVVVGIDINKRVEDIYVISRSSDTDWKSDENAGNHACAATQHCNELRMLE